MEADKRDKRTNERGRIVMGFTELFRLPDRVYNILKWIVVILLPAVNTLIFTIGGLIGKETGLICGVISAVTVFFGALIGVSTYAYNKEKAEANGDDV